MTVQEKIKEVCDLLLASKIFLHQIHLTYKDYADHLLADRLAEGLIDNIDRIKEEYIGLFEETSIADARAVGKNVNDYLAELPEGSLKEDSAALFEKQAAFFETINTLCNELDAECKSAGMKTVIGDVAEAVQQKLYLIYQRTSQTK